MNPLVLLGLIQLGAGIIGGWRASQEAAQRQALAERAMGSQLDAATAMLNQAAAIANKDITKDLAPYFSLLQGRTLSVLGGQAAAAGLTGSGLAIAADQGVRSEIAATLGKEVADWEMRKLAPLLQAQSAFVGLHGEMADRYLQMAREASASADGMFSWLPIAIQAGLFKDLKLW